MTYQIEIGIDLNKITNLSEIKNLLVDNATECKMEDYYQQYEHMGQNRKIYRNHCVISFFFIDHYELFADFIRYLTNIKNIIIKSVVLYKYK